MWRTIQVSLHERAVLLKDGLPVRALAPGRHVVFGFRTGVLTFDTQKLVFEAAPEARAVLPADWFSELSIAANERALVLRDGRPHVWLRPGSHRVWRVDPSVSIEMLSIDGPVPVLTPELRAVIKRDEIVELNVAQHERGLLTVDGRFERVLEPGRYAFWSPPEAIVEVARVDVRRQEVAIAGQELLTRDKVSLRLTLVADICVVDPVAATRAVVSFRDAIYLAVQIAARTLVSSMSLDELLEARDAVGKALFELIAPQGKAIGVELVAVGIKDIVLPGEMKTLLNRVIEAEKEAAANVIQRREETAATRQLANTARLMADNPILMRMRELELIKDIAGQLKEVKLVVGADKLEALMPTHLLARRAGD